MRRFLRGQLRSRDPGGAPPPPAPAPPPAAAEKPQQRAPGAPQVPGGRGRGAGGAAGGFLPFPLVIEELLKDKLRQMKHFKSSSGQKLIGIGQRQCGRGKERSPAGARGEASGEEAQEPGRDPLTAVVLLVLSVLIP